MKFVVFCQKRMSKLPVLTKNYEFHRVYTKGRYAASAFLVVYVLSNSYNNIRVGITASKKVGNSVKRNRMRRLIRENLKLINEQLKNGIDLVIVARKSEDTADLETIGKELRYLLNKLDVLIEENDA